MKRPVIIGAVFVVVGTLVGAIVWRGRSETVTYREVQVAKTDLQVTILATGTVQPENRLELKPPVSGRVEEVKVREGQVVKKGALLAWVSSTERAALLDAARAEGPEELKKWEENYKPTPVVAPIHGTIILRKVEPGQTVTASDALLVMSDRLTVKAQVDETDIAQIHLKQPAEIVLDAYSNEKISAQVDEIAFEAKTVNNVTTYVVDVLPNQTPTFMRAGMTANVTFQVATRSNATVVPTDAVTYQEGGPTVLVKGSGPKPQVRSVKLGVSDGKQMEVIEGVEPGEVVLALQVAPKGTRSKPANSSPFMGSHGPPGGGGRGGR